MSRRSKKHPMDGGTPHGQRCEKCGEVHNPKRCQGHSKRTGKQCGRAPMKGGAGGDKCDHHGAKSLSGPASPTWKTGEHARIFGGATADLLPAFERALADPDLESLRVEIATLEARMQQLLGRLLGGTTAMHWTRAYQLFEQALDDSLEPATRAAAIGACRELLRDGAADQAVWGEVYGVMEQRRRLAETQGKNNEKLRQTLTVKEAMTLLAYMAGMVKRHVKDRKEQRSILADLRSIAMGESSDASEPVDVGS